ATVQAVVMTTARRGYLTGSERNVAQRYIHMRPRLEEAVVVGVAQLQQQPYPRMPERPLDDEAPQYASPGSDAAAADDEATRREFPSHLLARGAVFRRRHRLHGPIVLYGGRIDPGKGCEALIQYFSDYVKDGGTATLALMGVKLMSLPEEPFIRFAGLLS